MNAKWDSHLAAISHDSVSRDLELQTLRGTEGKLIAEVRQLKEDIVRCVLSVGLLLRCWPCTVTCQCVLYISIVAYNTKI